jgi:hypothetical protein
MCEHCGIHYSFYFGVQYHKADCPAILAEREAAELRRLDRVAGLSELRGGALQEMALQYPDQDFEGA